MLLVLCSVSRALADPKVFLPNGYRLNDYNAPVPDAVPGGTVIHTQSLHALLANPQVILVDVLPAERRPAGMRPGTPWLPLPHRDLPGSLWLPDVGRGAIPPALDQWLDQSLLRACAGDRSRPVVVYCKADCWMSWNAAKRIAQHGWRHVYWYPDGPASWSQAGFPLVKAQPAPME